jgi:hypothetical protein
MVYNTVHLGILAALGLLAAAAQLVWWAVQALGLKEGMG